MKTAVQHRLGVQNHDAAPRRAGHAGMSILGHLHLRIVVIEHGQVSDLAFWNSKAVGLYGFNGIPYNILVDPDGKVIAENLRGAGLREKLEEVLN